MKYRLLSVLTISLLVITGSLGARPNLSMVSLSLNESVASTSNLASRVTLGFGQEELYGTASFRLQYPDTNLTLHMTKKVHGSKARVTGSLFCNLAYHAYGLDNGTTALIGAYTLKATTQSKHFPTLLSAGVGVQTKSSWSASYDRNLWNVDLYYALSIGQTFFDRLYANLFMATDTLAMREANLSLWYGLSLALALGENLVLVARPLVRVSDRISESFFITEAELAFSLCFSDQQRRRQWMEEMGVWL